MGLDLTKLENVRRRGVKTIARCPACAEAEGDHKGEHLFINDKGHFGCVLYAGVTGQAHRKRIFELAGAKEMINKGFEVKPAHRMLITVIQKDILGHLGHMYSTHAQKKRNNTVQDTDDNIQGDLKGPVPSVPQTETVLTSHSEDILPLEEDDYLLS